MNCLTRITTTARCTCWCNGLQAASTAGSIRGNMFSAFVQRCSDHKISWGFILNFILWQWCAYALVSIGHIKTIHRARKKKSCFVLKHLFWMPQTQLEMSWGKYSVLSCLQILNHLLKLHIFINVSMVHSFIHIWDCIIGLQKCWLRTCYPHDWADTAHHSLDEHNRV